MGGTPGGQSPLNRAGMHVDHESSKRWLRTTSLAQTWDVGNEREERDRVTCCGQKWPLLPSLSRDTHQAQQSSPLRLQEKASLSALPGVFVVQGPKVMFPTPLSHEQRETLGFSEHLSPHVILTT